MRPSPTPIGIRTTPQWTKLVLGLAIVFGFFHWLASVLGSDRGQAGVVVGALVVAATIGIERALFRTPVRQAPHQLGLGRPQAAGLTAAAGACLLLLLVVPAFARYSDTSISILPGAAWLVPGLFAQAGIAEETLFRGYLFGRLRYDRSFWVAASLSMLPFVAVHLLMFVTQPWPIAAASLALALVSSFPLAWLFELGGGTIWAPALLHFVIQGTVKLVVFPDDTASTFAVVWIAASAVVPLGLFAVPGRR